MTGYEELHGAANSAPRWTKAEIARLLRCDRGGVLRTKTGKRQCRRCKRDRQREYLARRRAQWQNPAGA